ncbi:MAG: EamA family transporter [Bacteroidia bacterium]|nr:EamA family transporter [Bacteroidia bacterium]
MVSIFWGTTFLAIRIGVGSFPPFIMAAIRHSIAGLILVSWFLLKGYRLPDRKALKTFSINGILMLAGGNGIISWGMQYVDSGLTALICALTPVWIVLINKLSGSKEKITKIAVIGFAVCLLGQIILFKDKMNLFESRNYLFGIMAIVVSNILWALGTVYSKNYVSTIPSLFATGLQMIPGGIILFIAAWLRGEFENLHPHQDALWALVYLIIFGSLFAYSAYIYMIKQLPASIASTYAYINTFVAILLGWLWLHETLDASTSIAMLITIAGVYLISRNYNA